MESVLKAPPDSTNSDLLCTSHEAQDNDSGSIGRSSNSVSTSPTASKSMPYRDPYLPEDDGSILTPEHAFVQYQTRSEDQACQICGQPAVGFHHRAYVCEACKKFFMRHTAARYRQAEAGGLNPADTVCPMGGHCRVEGPGRGKCPHCRYRKCLDLGMTLTPPGGESGCDISQIPCRVCGGPSSGFHFGALTCEGCKGFFRRTVLSNVRLECLSNNDCPITPANRNMCKSCRFQRCLAVGMSKTGSRIGRQPNAIKYYCAREISQISGGSTSEQDATQPTSSSSVSNGRSRPAAGGNKQARQRATSISAEVAGKASSSWTSVQPAQSSTDIHDRAHSVLEQNGQFDTILHSPSSKSIPGTVYSTGRPDNGFGPSSSSSSRRSSDGSGQRPDCSPQSLGKKKRRSMDAFTGRMDVTDSPLPTNLAYPLGDPNAYGSSQALSLRDPAFRSVSSARIPRAVYGSLNQSLVEEASLDRTCRGVYDPHTPADPLTHSVLTLEYSLPDPDTSSHISSSLSAVPEPDLLGESSGKLLAPLSVHMSTDDDLQSSYRLMTLSAGELRGESNSSAQFLYKDPSTSHHAHHYHVKPDAPAYRVTSVLAPADDPMGPSSPVPSSNLATTKPTLHQNDPNASQSRTTRSIVDHLTSTVLQFRNHRGRSSSSTTGSAPDSPSSINSQNYPTIGPSMGQRGPNLTELHSSRQPGIRPHPHQSTQQSPSLSHLSLSSYPSPSSLPHAGTLPATRIASDHTSAYSASSSCKPSSPELSWKPQERHLTKPENRSPPSDLHFRHPIRFDPSSSPVNGNAVAAAAAAAADLGHVVDVTSTSSASWFAAAAAAAAVANVIMVASHANPTSHSTASGMDMYSVDGALKTVSSRASCDPACLVSEGEAFRRSGSTNGAKRIKMSTASSEFGHGGRSPSSKPVTDSDLESIYALKLAKCTSDPSGTGAASGLRAAQYAQSSSPSTCSDLTMRAAAAAAAAAAATAAGLVLSNSRVRPDELACLHQPSLFGNAYSPPPTFARSLAAVTSAMDLARYPDRGDTINLLPPAVRTASSCSVAEPSVNLQTSGGAGSGRSKNGLRTAFISLTEFSEGIHAATKYMMSERKKIRDNLPQSCQPMHALKCVEDVWDRMMQHFELHSRFIVCFVKLIPGFNQLEMSDKRQLVRSAMYPLMLLELSRDYLNAEESRYNYFDFTENEREVILKHFPTFHTITGHLIRSGEFLTQIRLDNVELTLVCAQEVFKNYQGLIDPAATQHLYHLAGRALVGHIAASGKSFEERTERLRHVSPLLEELNLEHHQVIAQLRVDKPQLNFPELYTEMFQLSEEEEREQQQQQQQQQQQHEGV